MDTALTQKCSVILDRNLAKANCTENHVCTSCDTVVLESHIKRNWTVGGMFYCPRTGSMAQERRTS